MWGVVELRAKREHGSAGIAGLTCTDPAATATAATAAVSTAAANTVVFV